MENKLKNLSKFKKWSKIEESKRFFPDPSIIKKYASFIIPLYLTGELKCNESLIDEWLEMNLIRNKDKNSNIISDLEVLAVKQIHDDPTSQNGFNQMINDIENKSVKLERFLRDFWSDKKRFV